MSQVPGMEIDPVEQPELQRKLSSFTERLKSGNKGHRRGGLKRHTGGGSEGSSDVYSDEDEDEVHELGKRVQNDLFDSVIDSKDGNVARANN